MADYVIHESARCCWCAQPLVQVDKIWWCPTPACRQRQREHGLGLQEKKGGWRWVYVPTPKQVEFDACPAKYVLYGGAAGPGKSHAARWALYRRAMRQPGFEALILRKTFPELEKTHLRRMNVEQFLPALPGQREPRRLFDFVESKRIAKFENGSLIECGHMEDAEAVSKYLSSEYDVICADEGATFNPDGLLEISTRSVDRKPGGRFWVVSNPGGPASSMLLDFFIDHQPDFDARPQLADKYRAEDWVYIPGKLEDNPYLGTSYELSLAVNTKWRYEQLRHGDWRVFSGQFFSQWQERKHKADLNPSPECRWFRSMDWGRNQPGCVLWWAILPDHKLHIRREFKFQGMDEPEVAAGIKKIDAELGIKVSYTACDPSLKNKTGASHKDGEFTGQFIAETLGHYGVPCIGADNNRFNGWQRCSALLRDAPDGTPWLTVHSDCRYLLRSIAAAVSDKNDPDDVDTKSDDHALDAWRYGAMSRPNPAMPHKSQRTFAPGTMGALRQGVTRAANAMRRLGSESVTRGA